jgi:hypothetical protein
MRERELRRDMTALLGDMDRSASRERAAGALFRPAYGKQNAAQTKINRLGMRDPPASRTRTTTDREIRCSTKATEFRCAEFLDETS